MINSKLISELVSSDKTVFLCINTIVTNSDRHNNLFAHAQLQNSVNKALNTKGI